MAQDTSINGLRNQILTSIFGRRLGLDSASFMIGPVGFRNQVECVSSAGSTVLSTATAGGGLGSTALSPFGVSMVGATGASGTSHWLQPPVPGVRKLLFNPSTGSAVVYASTGAFFVTTGSATSTYQIATITAKGGSFELVGLTTAFWGVIDISQISTGGSGVTFV